MITISNSNHWLVDQTVKLKKKIAIISGAKKISYEELLGLSKRAGIYFKKKGVSEGDHVSILSDNSIEFVITINGLWLIGAIPIPLNTRLESSDWKKLFDFSESKYLVNINNCCNVETFDPSQIIYFCHGDCNTELELSNVNRFDSAAIAIMLFTSGSSGYPKCVPLTFDNIFASAQSVDSFINHKHSDIWLASLPFYHIGGFSIVTRTIIAGCSVAIPRSLQEDDFMLCIEKVKPSLLSFVPTMLIRMINRGYQPWENLRAVFVGGGPASEKVIMDALMNLWPLVTVYGSTETASMVTACTAENLFKYGLSAGFALDGVTIKIIDGDPKNNIGRIVISSKSVSQSYYLLSDKMEPHLKENTYFSNDIGKIDSKGLLHIIGRKDDIIISGGENISLSEIRKILTKELGDCEILLLGIAEEQWGQSYIIVLESEQNNLERKVQKLLNNNLAKLKHPKQIYVFKKLPRNELGKIHMNKIKRMINVDFL